ncbi:MAG: Fic family protein [Candidatus Thiosymbion ectosymbiont of Robbea hypermnestra]|nr:Fic family protein [Candidatus Thiosymbion ectosymbiont of Robbea hypermnestra]
MAYQRIEPFPQDAATLGSSELAALGTIWREKKKALQGTGVFQDFLTKLQREWAIETGIVERLYTWDRGITEVLIEQGIDAGLIAYRSGVRRDEADHIKQLIDDQLSVIEGLFSYIKGEQPLTEHFIRGLQAQFTSHQDFTEALSAGGERIKVALEKGTYKTLPNNPRRPDGEIHEYCPPEFTQEEMQSLIRWYRASEDKLPVEVEAAWLHHRFVQIHPFQDGNGRVARTLASLVFLKAGLFPLVIRDTDRQAYIGALEDADQGDLKPLIAIFARRQKESILRALGLEQQVQQDRYADQIIGSALKVLKDQQARARKRIGRVYDYADELVTIAETRTGELAESLGVQLRELTPPDQSSYGAYWNSARNDSPKKHYFYNQILEVAQKFHYFANLERYRAWIRLSIKTQEHFEFIVSIHGYGHQDTGIMAASAFTDRRVEKEEGGTEPVQVQPASVDLFQFNYAESPDDTKKRFRDWLEHTLAIALGEWKRLISA